MVAEIFQRFVQESPVAVMVRATLENAFAAPALDELFTQTVEQQYTRTLLFSTVVELMTTVVLRQEQSIHAAFQQRREQLGVGISSLYEKLGRMETGVSEALVRHSVRQVEPVLKELEPTPEEILPGYEVRILDGHHLAGTEHRLKPLRRTRAGALPGQSLVALDPAVQADPARPLLRGRPYPGAGLSGRQPWAGSNRGRYGWPTATLPRPAGFLGWLPVVGTWWCANMPRRCTGWLSGRCRWQAAVRRAA